MGPTLRKLFLPFPPMDARAPFIRGRKKMSRYDGVRIYHAVVTRICFCGAPTASGSTARCLISSVRPPLRQPSLSDPASMTTLLERYSPSHLGDAARALHGGEVHVGAGMRDWPSSGFAAAMTGPSETTKCRGFAPRTEALVGRAMLPAYDRCRHTMP